jgi:chromate transporter
MDENLLSLLGHLIVQSLLAIGGIYVILAELQRVVVVENGWLTLEDFTSLFALAQASPGPNTLFVSLIGWRMAGVTGGILATLVFVLPSLILAGAVARGWNRWSERRWFVVLRRGLVPLTIGLMASSALLLTLAAATGVPTFAIAAASFTLLLATRAPPFAILAGAGALGAFGLV